MSKSCGYMDKSKRVEALVACAESIIENAASIIGDEQYCSSVRVTIRIEPGEAPSVNVDKDFLPEAVVEGVEAYHEKKRKTREIIRRNIELNAARRQQLKSKG